MEVIFKLAYELIVTAHVAHLQTKSYAEHKLMQEIYDTLPDMIDSLMESYQGKNGGVIKNIGAITPGGLNNYQEYLSKLSRYIESQLKTTTLDIQDELIAILNFLNSVKYKTTLS